MSVCINGLRCLVICTEMFLKVKHFKAIERVGAHLPLCLCKQHFESPTISGMRGFYRFCYLMLLCGWLDLSERARKIYNF